MAVEVVWIIGCGVIWLKYKDKYFFFGERRLGGDGCCCSCGGFVFRRGKISFWVKDFTKFRGLELCHQPVVNLPKATLGARIGRTKGTII